MPQNDQSLLPDNTMDTRQLMGADSDETGRNAPSGAAGGMGGTWVYGERGGGKRRGFQGAVRPG